MKKVMLFFVLGIFLIGFVFAQGQGTGANNTNTGQENQTITSKQVKTGNYIGEYGERIQIQAKQNNRIQLRVRNVSASCGLNLTQEQVQNKTKLKVLLSNGRNAEIKVMPDTASETALAKLRLKVCSEENNCSIELKEVGKAQEEKVAYEIIANKPAKVFGLFKTQMKVQAHINAEDGEVIRIHKPWWSFLASEQEE